MASSFADHLASTSRSRASSTSGIASPHRRDLISRPRPVSLSTDESPREGVRSLYMRKMTRILAWVAAGGVVLQTGCGATLTQYLLPTLQPLITQSLTAVTSALTTAFIELTSQLISQLLGNGSMGGGS